MGNRQLVEVLLANAIADIFIVKMTAIAAPATDAARAMKPVWSPRFKAHKDYSFGSVHCRGSGSEGKSAAGQTLTDL